MKNIVRSSASSKLKDRKRQSILQLELQKAAQLCTYQQQV